MFASCVLATETGSKADEPLVDIAKAAPGIRIDLRYAGTRNVVGHSIYPPGAHAIVRQSVAARLAMAQAYLAARGHGLKVWDAYRPLGAQRALWAAEKSARYVADPDNGHPLHTWGVAVDATLVDAKGRDVPMPSGFDAFSSSAQLHYKGDDPAIAANLDLLLHAMGAAGFRGMRSEWWHFVAPDWQDFAPVTQQQAAIFAPATR